MGVILVIYVICQEKPMNNSFDPENVGGALLLTKGKVAKLVGVSAVTLDRMRRAGKFPPPVDALSAKKLYWRRDDVLSYIKNMAVLPR